MLQHLKVCLNIEHLFMLYRTQVCVLIHAKCAHLISGFEVLRSHYSALVKSMPDDYMNTVSQLESHLSGDHIGSILECRDMSTANQRILDCLIEQICTKEHLLDFCDWFSTLTKAPLLASVVRDIKEGNLLICSFNHKSHIILKYMVYCAIYNCISGKHCYEHMKFLCLRTYVYVSQPLFFNYATII